MARHFGKLAVALAALFIGGQALAHGHHSHGKPLTEVEKKAEAGVFDDKDVKDRDRADWEGVWQSVYPYLLNGSSIRCSRRRRRRIRARPSQK